MVDESVHVFVLQQWVYSGGVKLTAARFNKTAISNVFTGSHCLFCSKARVYSYVLVWSLCGTLITQNGFVKKEKCRHRVQSFPRNMDLFLFIYGGQWETCVFGV